MLVGAVELLKEGIISDADNYRLQLDLISIYIANGELGVAVDLFQPLRRFPFGDGALALFFESFTSRMPSFHRALKPAASTALGSVNDRWNAPYSRSIR